MVVDRGELRYNIQVTDQFTSTIRKFRTELLFARQTLESFRESTSAFRGLRDDLSGASRALRSFRSAQGASASEGATADRDQIERLRRIQDAIDTRTRAERLRAQAFRDERREATAAQRTAERTATTQARAASVAAEAARKNADSTKQLNRSLRETEGSANRIAFTFRRLFGIFAAFALVREGVAGFTALVGSAISFNRTVEDSQIGIQALITSLTKARDASGRLLEGPQAFAAAGEEARRQIDLLRVDSLRTVATFEDLIVTFQTALGPGLAAGLQIDQIRALAVNVSQAAAALGVAQNQLAEEIRALVIPGAATARTSRIFTALQIRPDELRAAKEAGTLFEFLQRRLSAFSDAADATQKTFTGLLNRLRESVQIAAGNAGLGFFNELKVTLEALGNVFVTVERDAKGAIKAVTPDQRTVQTLALLFNGLRDAVATLRAGFLALDGSAVQRSLALVASGFRVLAEVAVGFVTGLINGFATIQIILSSLFGGVDIGPLRDLVALATQFFTVLVGVNLTMSLIGKTIAILIVPFRTLAITAGLLSGHITAAGGAARFLFTSFIRIPLLVGVLITGLISLVEQITGVKIGFREIADIIKVGLFDGIVLVARSIELLFTGAVEGTKAAFKGLFNLILTGTQSVIGAVSGLGSLFLSEEERVRLEDAITKVDLFLEELRANPGGNVSKITDSFEALKVEAGQLSENFTDIFSPERQQQATSFVQDIGTSLAAVGEQAANIGRSLFTGSEETGAALFQPLFDSLAQLKTDLKGLINGDIIDVPGIQKKAKEAGSATTFEAQQSAVTLGQFFDASIQKLILDSQNFIQILTNGVASFGRFAADTIVDAFDPTQDVDLKERFARFLQDLARQILQTLFTLLIATAIAKAFGVPLPSGPVQVPSFPGLAEGGEVPGGHAAPTFMRPPNLDRRDTTPAWLQPGEYVQPLHAVARYGMDVMEAIRQGAIDPMALRSLAGLTARRTVSAAVGMSGPGFQAGGPVGGVSSRIQPQQAESQRQQASTGPVPAVVVPSDTAAERFLAGGKGGVFQFFRENASALDGILSRNRTR